MNGHLGVKSGPLAPTSCKLSKQMLVLQNMNAHYKKLQNVKSSIDMSAPKTLSTSVKSKDRMRREGKLPRRTPNSRPASSRASSRASNAGDLFSSNEAYADDPLVDQLVREAMAEESREPDLRLQLDSARQTSARSPYASKSGGRRALYDSARSNVTATPVSAKVSEAPDPSGDYLERHKQLFTNTTQRPFQPRLLRTNVPSKLSQFRFYSRPKSAQARKAKQPEEARESDVDRQFAAPDQHAADATYEGPRAVSLKDSDPYKVRWLESQAESARFRQDVGNGSQRNEFHVTKADPNGLNLNKEEEQLKYLQFVSDVTSDVLNRGVYTNKVLNHVFQQHLERNAYGLKVPKMMEVLQNIRDDLKIPADDCLDNTYTYTADQNSHAPTVALDSDLGHPPASRPAFQSEFSNGDPSRPAFLSEFSNGDSSRDAFQSDLAREGPPRDAIQSDLTREHFSRDAETPLEVTEFEESDLAIAQTAGSGDEHYELKELRANSPVMAAPSGSSEPPVDVTPPLSRQVSSQREGEGSTLELQTTQDELDFAAMRDTMERTIKRESSADSIPNADVTDAAAERKDYDREHWSRKAGLDESRSSEADITMTSTMVSESESGGMPMAATLRPGMFDTMLHTAALPPLRRQGPAAARMGRSVTFASQDEVLADTRDSDLDGATLTEVSAASSLELGGLRQSLPDAESPTPPPRSAAAAASVSTDYDDDFEDDDGF